MGRDDELRRDGGAPAPGLARILFFKEAARRIGVGAIAAAIPVGAVLVVGGLDLLSGPGVSEKNGVGAARIGWAVLARVATMGFAWLASRRSRRGRAEASPASSWRFASRRLASPAPLSRRTRGVYPEALSGGAPAAVARDLRRGARHRGGSGVGVAPLLPGRSESSRACSLLECGRAAFRGSAARCARRAGRAAYRETLFLKRALTHLKPAAPAPPIAPDPAIVEALHAAKRLDDALIDRSLPDRRRMNVLVISIDAVRADRLGRNGYARRLTPNLDALARPRRVLPQRVDDVPVHPHGVPVRVRGRLCVGDRPLPVSRARALEQPVPAAADRRLTAQEAGMADGGRGRVPAAREGAARAGARVRVLQRGGRSRSPGARHARGGGRTLAISALDREPERPFFLWVHFFDPHAPYSPPAPHPFGEAAPTSTTPRSCTPTARPAASWTRSRPAISCGRPRSTFLGPRRGPRRVRPRHRVDRGPDPRSVRNRPAGACLRAKWRSPSISPTSLRPCSSSSARRVRSACTGSRSFRACSSIPRRRERFRPTSRFASSEAPGFRSPGSSRRAREA